MGTLTGLAGLEVVREVGPQDAAIFCLGGLATDVPTVLDKTRAAERIIAVDGCPMNCALKSVEGAGFTPDWIINLVEDCGIQKCPPLDHGEAELQMAVGGLTDGDEAVGILAQLQRLINDTWDSREEIEPSTMERNRLNPLGVYKLLPGTNCRACGQPTCLVLANKLVVGQVDPTQCMLLCQAEPYREQWVKLQAMLDLAP